SFLRISAGLRPVTRTSLSRPCSPWTTRTAETGTPSAVASSAPTAALARPSTGGAVTRTVSVPSSPHVPIAARDARGCTRTRSSPSSGRAGIRVVDRLGVVALEHLRRELLLSDVVWGDAHRGLPPYPRLPASW